jgi:hypothetical protein
MYVSIHHHTPPPPSIQPVTPSPLISPPHPLIVRPSSLDITPPIPICPSTPYCRCLPLPGWSTLMPRSGDTAGCGRTTLRWSWIGCCCRAGRWLIAFGSKSLPRPCYQKQRAFSPLARVFFAARACRRTIRRRRSGLRKVQRATPCPLPTRSTCSSLQQQCFRPHHRRASAASTSAAAAPTAAATATTNGTAATIAIAHTLSTTATHLRCSSRTRCRATRGTLQSSTRTRTAAAVGQDDGKRDDDELKLDSAAVSAVRWI